MSYGRSIHEPRDPLPPVELYSSEQVRSIMLAIRRAGERDAARWAEAHARAVAARCALRDAALELMTGDEQRVYFCQLESDGPIKIGISFDAKKRVAGLQTANPYKLTLLGHVPGGALLEDALHKRFATDRIHGEWFKPVAPLIELVAVLTRAA